MAPVSFEQNRTNWVLRHKALPLCLKAWPSKPTRRSWFSFKGLEGLGKAEGIESRVEGVESRSTLGNQGICIYIYEYIYEYIYI